MTSECLNTLSRYVEVLNNLLPEFGHMWSYDDTLHIITDDVKEGMSPSYNAAFKEWMSYSSEHGQSAVHDFLDKISVSTDRINIDDQGSMWIDMSLAGTVDGELVTKMTRVTFRNIDYDHWDLSFDPTLDGRDAFD
jgi:hypothetical protein